MTTVAVRIYPADVVEVSTSETVVQVVPSVGERGPQGPQGDQGAQGPEIASFEALAQNVSGHDVTATTFDPGVQMTKTLSTPDGDVVITLDFDALTGLPTTKTLTGPGVPAGIANTCTYDFTGRTVPLKTYTEV